MTMRLKFDGLRDANVERLPLFTNKHGEVAHMKRDGSDWNFGQWLEAMFGEMGEVAQVRQEFENGNMGYTRYKSEIKKELPDMQIYLDLLSLRALDTTETVTQPRDRARVLMDLISELGQYANWSKKFNRGDIDGKEFESYRNTLLSRAAIFLGELMSFNLNVQSTPSTFVDTSGGVDLGDATIHKFNQTSAKLGIGVML